MCVCLMSFLYSVSIFFFFKQKPAYEIRISDWSSDVCSSDLFPMRAEPRLLAVRADRDHAARRRDLARLARRIIVDIVAFGGDHAALVVRRDRKSARLESRH